MSGAPEPGHEVVEPFRLDRPGQGQTHEGVEGPPPHGRDVAEVDVEGLAAEEARRVIGEPEILVLDEDVGREEERTGRPDQGGVVTDADQDVLPPPVEGAPDLRDHAPLAQVFQPHRASSGLFILLLRPPSRPRLRRLGEGTGHGLPEDFLDVLDVDEFQVADDLLGDVVEVLLVRPPA